MAVSRSAHFEAIGTQWEITVSGKAEAHWSAALSGVREIVNAFDCTFSRFRKNSFVRAISHRSGVVRVPADFTSLLTMYYPLFRLTGGAINPLIGRLLEDAGYDADYSFLPRALHAVPSLTDTVEILEPGVLRIKEPVLFDFGAIGKGYLIDLVYQHLAMYGYQGFSVNAGGDIRMHSASGTRLKVGLEHPDNTSIAIGIIDLLNAAIAGSAGNRRSWDRFHHIIDPRSGTSPKSVKASWAIAGTAALADGLSTALFFAPPEKLRSYYTFEYVVFMDSGNVHRSGALPGSLFSAART